MANNVVCHSRFFSFSTEHYPVCTSLHTTYITPYVQVFQPAPSRSLLKRLNDLVSSLYFISMDFETNIWKDLFLLK